MNGIEIISLMAHSFPKHQDAHVQLALGVAIKLAHDHWTDADDQKYGHYKSFIFQWAEEIGEIPPRVA